jgi:immune inhibitor A
LKKSFMQYLAAAVFAVAIPAAAQEPAALIPALDAKSAAAHIVVVEDEDGVKQIVGSDNLPAPKADARALDQREAVRQRVATNQKGGRTHQVARGQYVDFPVERTDRVFVMLVEFGDKSGFIANPTAQNPQLSTVPGPLHNQIAQPDRATDNTTIWQADYNREHYVDMYFNQMVAYYKSQSSGRYTFNGDVAHWVKVPFNGPRYGANSMGTAGMWTLIADTINTWTAAQIASGKTAAEVAAYLRTFDQWDRYDYDRDGNFDEADGYIDHFQIVHAGPGEETNTTAYADMIWSHRWNAFYHLEGWSGPSWNRDGGVQFGGGWGANPNGGTFGSANGHMVGVTTLDATAATVTNAYPPMPTGVWVNDYTVQPENGGLGVFAHEYGHDLGLPDHYDTAGGSNGTGYWTIMSSGSYLGEGGEDVGSRPGDMNAWDKLQLGWLTYDQADFGRFSVHKLGPAEFSTKAAQAVVIPLPSNQNFRFNYDAAAASGANGQVWASGSANNYEASMTRSIVVPATNATLSMRMAYNIEANWDYAYVSVSTNGGTSWTNLAAPGVTTTTNTNGQNAGNGITGSSGGAWRTANFNLAAYAGQTVLLRIRYWTDPFTFNWGLVVDDITIGGFQDTADAAPNGWTLNKFATKSPTTITNNTHFYIAEFRQYKGYDTGLQTGPYAGTGYLNGKVGHYPYQDGLLITYADYDHARNNTSVTPGEGFALQIDARPQPMTRLATQEPGTNRYWNFSAWTPAVQVYDATFGLDATDHLVMPFVGNLPALPGSPAGSPLRRVQFSLELPSTAAVPFFSDLTSYWSPALPSSSVILPKTGTSLRVISQSAQDSFMHIHVNPSSN